MEDEKERLLRFAYLYFRRGELDKALSFCEQILRKYPDFPDALELMGDIKVNQMRLKEASTYYRQALSIDPSRSEVKRKLEKVEGELAQLEKPLKSPDDTYPTTGRTALGMSENLEAALCYLFPGIFPFIVLLLEKVSRFARFHAIQSLLLSLIFSVIGTPFSYIFTLTFRQTPVSSKHFWTYYLFNIPGLLLSLFLFFMFLATLRGKHIKLPWIGDLAEEWC
ncbi:MAG: tetratricopeptide repeat protein [bacterium]